MKNDPINKYIEDYNKIIESKNELENNLKILNNKESKVNAIIQNNKNTKIANKCISLMKEKINSTTNLAIHNLLFSNPIFIFYQKLDIRVDVSTKVKYNFGIKNKTNFLAYIYQKNSLNYKESEFCFMYLDNI